MAEKAGSDYLLGVNEVELERLRFQHGVWRHVTESFLDHLGVTKGWHCLDVGAGPGFVTMDLRERVGENGLVVALEPSEFYHRWLADETVRQGWKNVSALQGNAEETALPAGRFDLIFARWVMSFVPDPDRFVRSLLPALKPGGIIAVQDYYYEGLSLFPRGGAFGGMADVVREYYRRSSGDPYVAGLLPGVFRKFGLNVVRFSPTCLSGGPGSGVMEWAHRFFTGHIPLMINQGIMSVAEGAAVLTDWHAHRENPDSLFFSPLVVDVAARLEPRQG